MDGPIRRVELPRIPPLAGPGRSGERPGRGGKRFAMDGEAEDEEVRAEAHEETDRGSPELDRRVGPAPPDEAGARVDVIA